MSDRNVDDVRRDALARVLCARLCDERRSIDELRVIDWILIGLENGAEIYGPLHVASDKRDWLREQAMELRDALVYAAAAALAKEDAR